MGLFIVNNPFDLPWQTNVYDALILGLFIAAVTSAVVRYRRGTRMYAFILASALIYGLVLELAGMATLNMYQQGDFAVMLNFPAIPLFEGTTAMPLYVTLFYPVIFSVGFRIIEALGIDKTWQAAVTGGLFMIFLDAPYIIEGNLRRVVWWTWDTDFKLFQFWLGWPLADMAWQGVWGAAFYYLMLRAQPHVDGQAERWQTARAFGREAPLRALLVIAMGPILLAPLTIFTFAVGPQWPIMVLTVGAMTAIAIVGLRSATPRARIDSWAIGAITAFVLAFTTMVIDNVLHEGRVTAYVAVQILGLVGVIVFATIPIWPWQRYRDTHKSMAVRSGSRKLDTGAQHEPC